MEENFIDNSIYILYSGKDENVLKIKDKIKAYIKYKLKLDVFDYQDKEKALRADGDERYKRMDTLLQAIQDGKVVVLHLDNYYLNSLYCLDELNILGQQNPQFYNRNLICLVHDKTLLNKIYELEISDLLKNIDKTIESFENKGYNLDGYRTNIKNFFNALKEYRYKAMECTTDEQIKEACNNINLMVRSFKEYIDKLKKEEAERKKAFKNINELLPKINENTTKKPNKNPLTPKILKSFYKSNFRTISLLLDGEEKPIDDIFVNLAIINEEKKEKDKEKTINTRNDILSSYEEIYKPKEPIDIKDLISKAKVSNTSKALIFGKAGIGKTTLCKYIAYNWANGKLFSEFDYVIYLPLRDWQDDGGLKTAIKNQYLGRDEKRDFDIDRDKTLFLFDGYDEIKEETKKVLNKEIKAYSLNY